VRELLATFLLILLSLIVVIELSSYFSHIDAESARLLSDNPVSDEVEWVYDTIQFTAKYGGKSVTIKVNKELTNKLREDGFMINKEIVSW
jgi:hypothetical protein